jgi:hypothetical protein
LNYFDFCFVLFVCFRTHSQVWSVCLCLKTTWHSFTYTCLKVSFFSMTDSNFLQEIWMTKRNSLKFTMIFTTHNNKGWGVFNKSILFLLNQKKLEYYCAVLFKWKSYTNKLRCIDNKLTGCDGRNR